jgi:hypothetical protein
MAGEMGQRLEVYAARFVASCQSSTNNKSVMKRSKILKYQKATQMTLSTIWNPFKNTTTTNQNKKKLILCAFSHAV